MHEHLNQKNNKQENNEQYPNVQGEITTTFNETWEEQQQRESKEKIDKDIKIFQKLAQYYYDINLATDDTTSNVWKDKLYVIINYAWTEKLVLIGTGNYTPEMFTKKHMDTNLWFLYGPLSLFVVKQNTHDDTDVNPRLFLNEHTSFYSQMSWEARFHQNGNSIEYGKYNKVMSYEEAINELQNASVRKAFYKRTSKRNNLNATFIKNMKILKQKEREWIKNWYENKVKFDFEDQEYMKLRTCLFHLAHKNVDEIYTVIQSFDRHKGLFILPKTM